MAKESDFDEDDLRELAGPRSFERGRGYLAAVTAVEVGAGWITATVHGTGSYQAERFVTAIAAWVPRVSSPRPSPLCVPGRGVSGI
ncbi:hypothetical protein ACGFYV_20355 [Streptomyces sp. NPDC048297]|uniref:hypothetical protein n=1 Tax=Streptomyces sp. NPDC048297 TaxID=3365531 RepID=UPI00371CA000